MALLIVKFEATRNKNNLYFTYMTIFKFIMQLKRR